MSPFTYRPGRRENTPLIVGIAGPTKSGKTKSAHRLAVGLAQGGLVAMINTEGARGHQYGDQFEYLATDIEAPYRPQRFTEALNAALALTPKPVVVIIDSGSHMHNGPGGILDWHEEELDRIAGDDMKKRERATWTAWIEPKAAENEFVYTMLSADCHIVLCLRAKEKLKIVRGKQPIPLGWQPIIGDAVSFETMFTLVLPPHSKGVPDLSLSEMREPYDSLIPAGVQLSEQTGEALAKYSVGVRGEPTEFDEEIVSVGAELLGCSEVLGQRDAVQRAIVANKRGHSPDRHLAWLRVQLERCQVAAAAVADEAAAEAAADIAFGASGPELDPDAPEIE